MLTLVSLFQACLFKKKSLVSPGFPENWHTETGKGGAQYHWSVSWGVGVGGSVLVSLKTGSTKQGKVGHIITGQLVP